MILNKADLGSTENEWERRMGSLEQRECKREYAEETLEDCWVVVIVCLRLVTMSLKHGYNDISPEM